MICVITRVTLNDPMDLDAARARFTTSASRYLGIPGLVRKYFNVAPDGTFAVGVYLWKNRQAAEAFYTEAWLARQQEIFGRPLEFTWLNCPVVAESEAGRVVADA